MNPSSRIVIADNHPASSADFRASLETQPDFTIAAAVTCASCSFTAVSRHKTDLVILKLAMPGHRILQLVKDLVVLHAGLKFLIVSSLDLEAERVLGAGAHGCVMASSSSAAKINAVRQVLAGNHCFTAHANAGLHWQTSCPAMT
ncbi:MAG: two component transcriptional regulator, LuxR family [Prosthecobacter sp.]|nr:two component transcriptional regulator, LuxR family [Prosthecobacter sp.]